MEREAFKKRVAELTLAECKEGRLRWYYISMAGEMFGAGFVIEALGIAHATYIIHTMGWYIEGCETKFIECKDIIDRIPEEQRWRPLNREECLHLGAT